MQVSRADLPKRGISAVRTRAQQRLLTRVIWRVIVSVLGLSLLAAGLGMLVLPGPGWGAIILGLVVLASEFSWARSALHPIREMAHRAAARAMDPAHRRRNVALGMVFVLAVAALVAWYLNRYGLSLPFTLPKDTD